MIKKENPTDEIGVSTTGTMLRMMSYGGYALEKRYGWSFLLNVSREWNEQLGGYSKLYEHQEQNCNQTVLQTYEMDKKNLGTTRILAPSWLVFSVL